jgi:hypothetical protein
LETYNSFTGLPPWWSEVLFVCVLRPVVVRGLPFPSLRGDLDGFARELAGLKFQSCLKIRLLLSLSV